MDNINQLKFMSPEQRQLVFDTEFDSVTEEKYMKPLNDQELIMEKEALATASIAKAMLEQELKEIKDSFKEQIEPQTEAIKNAMQAIRFRAKQVEGKLYKYIDRETKVVYFCDPDGNVIDSRMMRPEERQYMLKPEMREAI